MNKYSKENLIEYLNKISKSKKTIEYTCDFYDSLVELNETIPKELFENLKIKNKNGVMEEIQQDIVIDTMQDKNSIKLEELFVYNFINNVNSIKTKLTNSTQTGAELDIENKTINIYLLSQKNPLKNLKSAGLRGLIHPNIANKIKLSTFHELSHLIELKSYNKQEFSVFGLRNMVWQNLGNNIFDYKYFDGSYLQIKSTDITAMSFIQHLGSMFLAETFNDIFSNYLSQSGTLGEDHKNHKKNMYYQKNVYAQNVGNNYLVTYIYCENYDIYALLQYALPQLSSIQARISPMKFINCINNLNFSRNVVDEAKYLLNELEIIYGKEISNWDLLTSIIGLTYDEHDVLTYDNKMHYKIICQAMLLSSIKTNTINDFKKINKNKDFYYNLGRKIYDMDNVLIYTKKELKTKNLAEREFIKLLVAINKEIEKLPANEQEIAWKELYFIKDYLDELKKEVNLKKYEQETPEM